MKKLLLFLLQKGNNHKTASYQKVVCFPFTLQRTNYLPLSGQWASSFFADLIKRGLYLIWTITWSFLKHATLLFYVMLCHFSGKKKNCWYTHIWFWVDAIKKVSSGLMSIVKTHNKSTSPSAKRMIKTKCIVFLHLSFFAHSVHY